MIKILHSADWHLDSPMLRYSPTQAKLLRQSLQSIPGLLADACRRENCDLVLLSGDLFDGAYAADTLALVKKALADMAVPVFISPGNHDFVGEESPWLGESWPENVHIFTHPVLESVDVPALDCCVYGAGFIGASCMGLLRDFTPNHTERYGVGVLHGDPTQINSDYCPVTQQQVAASGLHYLGLGHIHKGGFFQSGETLCAWPGCPMGRGYDETGEKGYYIVTVGDTVAARFVPLPLPRFFDLTVTADTELSTLLPPVGNDDFYRITLTGPWEKPDLAAMRKDLSRFPNLELRDETVPPTEIWGSADQDTFEGMYFKLLQDAMAEAQDESARKQILLAAQLSRQLLDGQEVALP